MEPKGGGIIHSTTKRPKDSSMTYDESEDLSYRVSKLEDLIRGSNMRMIDLVNLEERMGHMVEERIGKLENKMEENMARIFKLIQNPEDKLPKDDVVAQGTQEDKDSV